MKTPYLHSVRELNYTPLNSIQITALSCMLTATSQDQVETRHIANIILEIGTM
jgi:hypothetical protein